MKIPRKESGLMPRIIHILLYIMIISFLAGGILILVNGGAFISFTGLEEKKTEQILIPCNDTKEFTLNLVVETGSVLIKPMEKEAATSTLMEATVQSTHPVSDRISTETQNQTTLMEVQKEECDIFNTFSEEDWDIYLNPDCATSLSVLMGDGDARLYLDSINLTSLDVSVGTGTLVVYVTGADVANLPVRITNGIGHTEIILPESTQIHATIQKGIGDLSVTGFEQIKKYWVHNTNAEPSPVITLEVDQGIGDLVMYTL